MQSVNHPVYTYDALGRLVNYTPSGATNDVVSKHVLLDPRIPGPRSLAAGGLKPVPVETPDEQILLQQQTMRRVEPVLNAKQLYVPPLSLTSPPVARPKTAATQLGYASFETHPEAQDVYSITTFAPILDVPHDSATKRVIR
jgi:hypothetical protein